MAETISNYCQKGSLVGVSGRLCVRNYMNDQKEKVYVTEVIADGISLLEKKKSNYNHTQIDEIFCEKVD